MHHHNILPACSAHSHRTSTCEQVKGIVTVTPEKHDTVEANGENEVC